jgi:hypothetical protein
MSYDEKKKTESKDSISQQQVDVIFGKWANINCYPPE